MPYTKQSWSSKASPKHENTKAAKILLVYGSLSLFCSCCCRKKQNGVCLNLRVHSWMWRELCVCFVCQNRVIKPKFYWNDRKKVAIHLLVISIRCSKMNIINAMIGAHFNIVDQYSPSRLCASSTKYIHTVLKNGTIFSPEIFNWKHHANRI